MSAFPRRCSLCKMWKWLSTTAVFTTVDFGQPSLKKNRRFYNLMATELTHNKIFGGEGTLMKLSCIPRSSNDYFCNLGAETWHQDSANWLKSLPRRSKGNTIKGLQQEPLGEGTVRARLVGIGMSQKCVLFFSNELGNIASAILGFGHFGFLYLGRGFNCCLMEGTSW